MPSELTSSEPTPTDPSTDHIDALLTECRDLRETVADQQATIEAQQTQIESLESRLSSLEETTTDLQTETDELETTTQINTTRIDSLDGAIDAHDQAIAELQSRELEKNAHLALGSVARFLESTQTADLSVDGERLERFTTKDGTQYVRLPDAADPLERSGTSALAQGDLLPIQQLARLDDDMLRANVSTLPTRLAARCWRERIGDDSNEPWKRGSNTVRQYLDASDLRTWIRRVEDGISDTYAKKLARRTMDALTDLGQGRLYQQKMTHRKDGLRYKETRLILPSDSAIPGEQTGSD
ncbi:MULTISPECIES: hypothetical protein [Salinibaculum]|uniref:hypothetical protein n=1 Tax=Salinibaculum TaxID=2732368 RepID=UPI0030CB598A